MDHTHDADPELDLSMEDLQAALRDMPTSMDITSEDLHTVYTLALGHARARCAPARVVQEIMTTAVVTLPPEADLQTAAQVLSEHQISGAPVIDPHGHVLGVVSEADLLGLVGLPRDHTIRDLLRHLLGDPLPGRKTGTTVATIMITPAITVQPVTPIREAAQLLVARRIKRLPVVDAAQRLVGILARADIVKVLSTL
jgi:CBS domain-containing membrane protein